MLQRYFYQTASEYEAKLNEKNEKVEEMQLLLEKIERILKREESPCKSDFREQYEN